MNAYIRKENGYDVMGIEGATIFKPFTNFAEVDARGNHHFNIEIDPKFVDVMKKFGFEPKFLDGQGGKYQEHWIIDVVIGYRNGDPGVTTVAHNGVKTALSEDNLGDLDKANVSFVDMTLTRHYWDMNGRKGVKPWGKDLYFYLAGPSFAEQRYLERFGDVAVERTPIPTPEPVQDSFIPVEDEDISF